MIEYQKQNFFLPFHLYHKAGLRKLRIPYFLDLILMEMVLSLRLKFFFFLLYNIIFFISKSLELLWGKFLMFKLSIRKIKCNN